MWWAVAAEPGAAARAWLSAPERARLERSPDAGSRGRFGTGAVLLRHVLGRFLGCHPASVPLDRTCPSCGAFHGPPRLRGAATGLRVSVSHSGGHVGVAVARGVAVGVDVQVIPENVDALLAVALSERERAAVLAVDAAGRPRAFTRLWTAKEAIIKALGLGADVHWRDLELGPDLQPLVPAGALTLIGLVPPEPGLAAAIALGGPFRRLGETYVSLDGLRATEYSVASGC